MCIKINVDNTSVVSTLNKKASHNTFIFDTSFFLINNQKFKESPGKSQQFLNNLPGQTRDENETIPREKAKTLFQHRKPKRNAQKCALHTLGVPVMNYGAV